jgi:hypothetical protein
LAVAEDGGGKGLSPVCHFTLFWPRISPDEQNLETWNFAQIFHFSNEETETQKWE